MSKFRIFTDGSFTGTTGDGGYACLLLDENDNPLLCVRDSLLGTATNNIMELEALRQAIIIASGFRPSTYDSISICTDSRYSLEAITKWSFGWRRRGWKTADNRPVSNKELIQDIMTYWEFCRKDKIKIQKVKAHATCYWNNVVDLLAKGARIGVCGQCEAAYSEYCKICSITRSVEWLSKHQPTLNNLIKMRDGNVRS